VLGFSAHHSRWCRDLGSPERKNSPMWFHLPHSRFDVVPPTPPAVQQHGRALILVGIEEGILGRR
jgi:hypothetical protein